MSIMMEELGEAPRVILDAVCACNPVAKAVAEECSKRQIRRIILAGRGSSLHAGIAFKYFLESNTPYTLSFEYPSLVTLFKAQRNLEDTLYIVVSQSGVGPDTLNFAKTAKAQGALVMGVTNFSDSPLAKNSDFVLNICAGEEKAVAATKTLTGQIVALEVLAYALAGKELNLDNAVSVITKILSSPLPTVPEELKKTEHVICLSRGITEAVAKESGLKLMETCYIFSFAASTNEFQHGPKALLRKDLPVLLFAPSGRCSSDFIAAAKDLINKDAYLIAFTDIKEVEEISNIAVKMPTVLEEEQTVVYLVAMQRFVASLCQTLGLNPDAPRNINKVTITN